MPLAKAQPPLTAQLAQQVFISTLIPVQNAQESRRTVQSAIPPLATSVNWDSGTIRPIPYALSVQLDASHAQVPLTA